MSGARLAERLARFGESLLDRRYATLAGWRLTFDKVSSQQDWVGYANIVAHEGGRVDGTLNTMSLRALEALDSIELVPNHYSRCEVAVTDADSGRVIPAFTYLANPAMIRSNLKPTRDYIEHLLAASDVLPAAYLDQLKCVECWT